MKDDYPFMIKKWIKSLLFPFGSFDHPLPCVDCRSDFKDELMDPESAPVADSGGVLRSMRIDRRLSVSVYCIRRGATYEFTRALGRYYFYDCLYRLFELHFHPTFVVIFLYYASIVHYRHKAQRGKVELQRTATGWSLQT